MLSNTSRIISELFIDVYIYIFNVRACGYVHSAPGEEKTLVAGLSEERLVKVLLLLET